MLDIETHHVKSSQIKAIGYDPEARRLRVVFNPKKDGACSRYDYLDVPAEVANGFNEAESVGKYFGANVKRAGFEFEKLPDLPAPEEEKATA